VYRLPTEAEWEYACRAGTATAFHFGNRLSLTQANFGYVVGYREALGRPCEVNRVDKPNAFGLHGMHGNVMEWCNDWFDRDYYKSSPKQDPPGPSSGRYRVLRGGAWNNLERFCRSAFRSHWPPDVERFYPRQSNNGFRVACEIAGR
jgi:formylglycine-generating enzyme required for sulfatase activity